MSRKNKIIAHLTFWIISIGFSVYIWGMPYFQGNVTWFIIGSMPVHVSCIFYFYIFYFVLVPFFLARKRYVAFALLTLVHVAFHIICCAYLWSNSFSWDFIYTKSLGPMTYECVFYGIVSIGFRVFELWDKSEEYKHQLEKELKESEMLFLQSQMSPHFLFNTLNNIYGLSLNHSEQTAKSIRELKNLMRYFEHFEKGQKITFAHELNYLNAFVELNRLRNPVAIDFSIYLTELQKTRTIEPMLLIPFIENAFKHGDLNQEIKISLSLEHNILVFSVLNAINVNKRKDSTGGIGIQNVKRRLELLYPGKYSLNIKETEISYHSTLNLELL